MIMSVISDYCQMRFSLCAGPRPPAGLRGRPRIPLLLGVLPLPHPWPGRAAAEPVLCNKELYVIVVGAQDPQTLRSPHKTNHQ